jgi:cytochrome oxidase Cu insertion factor (SCO1/SenC/PrrC family)
MADHGEASELATSVRSSQRATPTRRRSLTAGLVGLALVLAAVLVAAFASGCRRTDTEALPVFWPAPRFSLTDQQGRTFGSDDLGGRAAVVSFVYTNCKDTCPLLTATMAQVQGSLRREGLLGSNVQLVSVTVDPDRDSPDVLSAYASKFRADPDAWRFLTGDRESVFGVLAGFKLNSREVARAFAGADEVPHSNRFAVVDPQGQVRANLQGDAVSAHEVIQTVKRVLP